MPCTFRAEEATHTGLPITCKLPLGWQFTVNTAIDVTALGVFDSGQDGLVESHDVGIWDSTCNLLVSATVQSGTTDPLTDQFRYVDVSTTLLNPGVYNIGAVWLDGSDFNTFPGDVNNFATIPDITFNSPAYIGGGTLADPTNNDVGTLPSYFGPNFKTPEPSTVLLLGVQMLLVAMLFRRRHTSHLK